MAPASIVVPEGAGTEELALPRQLADRFVDFELRLRDKVLSYLWGTIFFFLTVVVRDALAFAHAEK